MPPTIVRDHQQLLVETMLEIARLQNWWSAPINLGGGTGGGGGSGTPIGGFAGQLIQSKVAYDTTESTDPTLPPSGRSLVHNLNKIRYDITQISGGGGAPHTLGSATHTDVTITSVDDDDILAYDSGGDWINQTAAEANLATAGHAHSDVVDVSADDTTAGYLEDKIVQGSNIAITVLNDGGDEDLEIAVTGLSISGHLHVEADITDLSHDAVKIRGRDISTDSPVVGEAYRWSGSEWTPSGVAGGAGDTKKVLVSSNDTTESYLEYKIVAGTNITITTLNEGANETVEITSTASGGGGSAIVVKDEAIVLTSGVTSLDFVGGGITATTVGNDVTVTVASGVGGGSTYSFFDIDKPKAAADTPDDEFSESTLDGKWTVVSGSSGTVSLFESANVSKYDLTTRPGNLLMQVGQTGAQEVMLRQDYTLPDGKSIIASISPALMSDAESGIENNELQIGISLNDNDTGHAAGNSSEAFFDANADGWRVIHVIHNGGSTTVGSFPNGAMPDPAKKMYFRISRVGSSYTVFWSGDGSTWFPLTSDTPAVTFDNVWIWAESSATFGDPIPIQVFDWVRLGTNDLDPWDTTMTVQLV